jgi:uncharacterized protein YndB with AHSA1/START domain
MTATHVEAVETINAPPAAVYDLVADLTQMGRWSPEAVGGKWLGAASGPTVGAKFKGNNRSGWRRWSTVAEVVAAEPGKQFTFHITVGGVPIADWTYEFSGDGTTTTVTEKWDDRRPGWMDKLSGVLMGVPDRGSHNQANMQATLAALKTAAESAPK